MNNGQITGEEDRELVRRCLGGEVDAFRVVVEKYQHKINLLIYGVTLDRDVADDLTQETFIRAYQALPRFRGNSALYTWLYKIAFNLALDEKRRRKRWPQEQLDDTMETATELPCLGSEVPPPDRQALREELKEVVRDGLEVLTEPQRTVLVLREWEGLSYQDIAAVMKCSVGTVMSRLYYAREKVKEHLERYLRGGPGDSGPRWEQETATG